MKPAVGLTDILSILVSGPSRYGGVTFNLRIEKSAQAVSKGGGKRAPQRLLPTGNPFVCRSEAEVRIPKARAAVKKKIFIAAISSGSAFTL
jgi:hypothetical protein